MPEYTIRQGFTLIQGTNIFSGGDTVELSELEFTLHKHKLEGVNTTVVPIETKSNSDQSSYPAPYLKEVQGKKIPQGASRTITLIGSFFTPDMSVECAGLSTVETEFVNSHLVALSVTATNTIAKYSIQIDNGRKTVVDSAIEVFNFEDSIVDLRSSGTDFPASAIEMRSGMSFVRTESGIYFTGSDPWSSWVRFVGPDRAWTWGRETKKTISWIFKNSDSFMIGIGSFASNPTNSGQYYQAEILGYFSSDTSFSGFYGNNGSPGTGSRSSGSYTFGSSSLVKKLVLENNGEPGSTYKIYVLPSEERSDWGDTSNLVASGAINNTMTANEQTIMPFAIPRNGRSTVFLGFILE